MRLPHREIFAALEPGAHLLVNDGKVRLRVPPGTQTGKTFRVRGHGIEDAKGVQGDLLVTVNVTVPDHISAEGKELLKEFRLKNPQENPRSHLGV